MNIFPRYQNKELKATKNSAEELWQLKKDLWDVLKILEKGYECSASRRKPNILEKCIQKGNIIFKAVVADCEDYFLLIHFGKFTRRK
ncbi:hypothetical protein HY498_04965 [Candidatus Woesearchaeota archaeon]|nr:hypothetical protein [Candidatus Woesearchaeota archaeon]